MPIPIPVALRAATLIVAVGVPCAAARADMPDGSVVSLDAPHRLRCEIRGRVGEGAWQVLLQRTYLGLAAQPLAIDWDQRGSGPAELRQLAVDCLVMEQGADPASPASPASPAAPPVVAAPAALVLRYCRAFAADSDFWITADANRIYPAPGRPLRLRLQPMGSTIAAADDADATTAPAIWAQVGDADPFNPRHDVIGTARFYARVLPLLLQPAGGAQAGLNQPGGDRH